MIYGADISNNQPQDLNFATLSEARLSFIIHKATESTFYTDPYLSRRWQQIKAAGMARGAYHFAQPDKATAQAEAEHFISVVRPLLEPGDIVALDLEVGSGDLSGWALPWLRTVEKALGFKPFLYTYSAFIQEHLQDPALAQFPLWLASWMQYEPVAPKPWNKIALWQNSAHASFPGLPECDEDTFSGSLDELRAYGKPAPVPPAPKPPADPEPAPTTLNRQDAGFLGQVDKIVHNIEVHDASDARAKLKAFLQTHPA